MPDDGGGSGILLLLDVAQRRFAEAFRGTTGSHGLENLVATCVEPVRSFFPLPGMIVAVAVLPYKLQRKGLGKYFSDEENYLLSGTQYSKLSRVRILLREGLITTLIRSGNRSP